MSGGPGMGNFVDLGKMAFSTAFKAASDEEQARIMANAFDLLRKAAAEFGPEILPHLAELIAPQLGETALKGRYDDAARGNQVKALAMLERQFMDPEGSPEARAAYTEAADRGLSQARAEQATLADSMAKRGAGGSGLEYALQQQAAQQGVQQANRSGMATAAGVRQNALQALNDYAGLSSTMRGQDWQRFVKTAEAQDAINRFNANMNWTGQVGNQQRLNQMFMNEMMQGRALGDVYTGMSKFDEREAERAKKSSEEWNAIMGGWMDAIGGMGNAAGGMGGM